MSSKRRLSIPLFWYVAVALGVPFSNGGYDEPRFLRHAAWVLGTLGVASVLYVSVRAVASVTRRRALQPVEARPGGSWRGLLGRLSRPLGRDGEKAASLPYKTVTRLRPPRLLT